MQYIKPILEQLTIEISDVIAISNGGETKNGISDSINDLFEGWRN